MIRDAEESDLHRIQSIYAYHVLNGLGSFEEIPPDVDEIARRFHSIREQGCPYIVSIEESSGILQGYAYAGPYRSRSAYRYTVENSVYVAPDHRGFGVGGTLLKALVAMCEQLKKRQMVAVIGDSGNEASIRLHRAQGFEHAGTLKSVGYKHGRWVDTVFMQKELGPGDTLAP